MTARRGSQLLVKRGDGATPTEAFTTVGALRNATVEINGNPIDVTTNDDVDANNEIWQTYITGVKTMTVSGDGIAKAIEPAQSIYEDFAEGNVVNYEIVVPYFGTWTAPFIVSNMSIPAAYDGVIGFSLTLQLNGAPTFVAEVGS